ncbi:T9SS type A sorting domain-containing protein [Fulvivirga sp. M361]|uniref:T9SS type A sorting domain-containing protein n=1 Tax=Fulvivirga sp. M361 TaxID=2594266 RepID=UPI00117B100D|nr:right-handed parallel beta-helix repeat-containing protein [Fulvivirga sp. M361]TRX57640.1 T9SS type A sorting domain-containing protein [Fulvivirga sp. M361]
MVLRIFTISAFLLSCVMKLSAQDNLVAFNAGFEDKDIVWSEINDDWLFKRWGNDNAMFASRGQTVVRSGSYSVSINIDRTLGADAPGLAGIRRTVTGMEKGASYRFKFYIFAENSGDQEVIVTVGDFTKELPEQPIIIASETLSYQGGSWQEVSFLFNADAADSDFSEIRFDLDFKSAVGQYYIDDFSLVAEEVKTAQQITFDALPAKEVGDTDFMLTGSASSGLDVSYTSSNLNVATISGNMVSIIADGSTDITASQAGNTEFSPAADVVRTLLVTDPGKSMQTISFDAVPEKKFGDAPFPLSGTASSGLAVNFFIESGPVTLEGNVVTITGAGEAVVRATQSGDGSFNAAPPVSRTINILKADQIITIEPIADVYQTARMINVVAETNSGLTLEYAVSGPATISGDKVTVEGSVGEVTVTVTQAGNENYNAGTKEITFQVLSCMSPGAECTDGVFYVSKSGDDSNPGTQEAPFLTIQQAADIMISGEMCIIQEGVYRESIVPANDDVKFMAADGADVELSAFDELGGWQTYQGSTYVTDIPVNLGAENMLLYDDQIMILARWPNKTNFNPFDIEAVVAGGDVTKITNSNIPDQDWGNGGIVWFLGKSRWTSWRRRLTGYASGQVTYATLSDNWDYGGSHNPSNGGEFFLMNTLEALDANGEWYVNNSQKKLYFRAPNGEDLSDKKVKVRQRTTLLDLDGRKDITFEGIKLTGGNILMGNAQRCIIKNCEILYGNHTTGITGSDQQRSFRTGQASIIFGSTSSDNTIERNNIQWGAGSGILLRGTNNTVSNNYIGNFDYLGSYEAPIRLEGENKVLHNEIFNAGRDAINGGGTGAEVAYNDIHHSNLINDDCGGIYLCCNSYGNTRIHHNWIHDISSRNNNFNSFKGTGIYLDNTTKDVIVDHNVLWGLEWTGIQINWAGTNLLIYNNTIWSNDGPESSTMGRWVNGYEFTNVPLFNTLANNEELHFTEEKNSVILKLDARPFVDYEALNFMPSASSPAVDSGIEIEGFTEGFSGQAPDAGAYERGQPYWTAGPDWQLQGVAKIDCNGDENGTAYLDKCGTCVEGNTGVAAEEGECSVVTSLGQAFELRIYPNPSSEAIFVKGLQESHHYVMNDLKGRRVAIGLVSPGNDFIDVRSLKQGIYVLRLTADKRTVIKKFVIN